MEGEGAKVSTTKLFSDRYSGNRSPWSSLVCLLFTGVKQEDEGAVVKWLVMVNWGEKGNEVLYINHQLLVLRRRDSVYQEVIVIIWLFCVLW